MEKYLFILFILCNSLATAQHTAEVYGRIVEISSLEAIENIDISIPISKKWTTTNKNGEFTLSRIPYGHYELIIGNTKSLKIKVNKPDIDLGQIEINEIQLHIFQDEMNTDEIADGEEMSDYNNVSGVLNARRDLFLNTASFTFSPMHFRLRGLPTTHMQVLINVTPMNDLKSGMAHWGQWGGLNDIIRNQNVHYGLFHNEHNIGGALGSNYINIDASSQRKQTKVTYSNSNRSYHHRIMINHNTGVLENGWALSVMASQRWAKSSHIPATAYQSNSYYLSLSKMIDHRNSLHIMSFGAPVSREKSMPATQEILNITQGNYYNPNWGWINGKKVNSKNSQTFFPTTILQYNFEPNKFSRWTTSFSYQYGYSEHQGLDWYQAQDPRPDYYKNLPSYYYHLQTASDTIRGNDLMQELSKNPDLLQIDWKRIYDANRMNQGNSSLYVIGADIIEYQKVSFSTVFQKMLHKNFIWFLGAQYQQQWNSNYKKMIDLLGGNHYTNLNQFAERTYGSNPDLLQYNLNEPNKIIKEGDIYYYHYLNNFKKTKIFTQAVSELNRVEFFLAVQLHYNDFNRTGIFKNGLYPTNSEGKSTLLQFINFDIKGGMTYKLNGRNYFFINAGNFAHTPQIDNTFITPRTHNKILDNVQSEQYYTAEMGYLIRSPYLNGKLVAHFTQGSNINQIKRFYHEDYRTFVNYAIQNVKIQNSGLELALQAKVTNSLTMSFVAAHTQAIYVNRPQISIYQDNDTQVIQHQEVSYLKNYYQGVGPQTAISIGSHYNAPSFWFANFNINYFDRNYMEANPSRLTSSAIDLVTPDSDQWNMILSQHRLPKTFTTNIFIGKNFGLKKALKFLPYGAYMGVHLGVNNILNDTKIISGGYEQLRFDYNTKSTDQFAPKLFIAQGRNYFLNCTIKF